jgi:hypothetical protein
MAMRGRRAPVGADFVHPLAIAPAWQVGRPSMECRLPRALASDTWSSRRRAADELIGLCACLPLALNIAASPAAAHPGTPLSSLAAELHDMRRRLDLLSAGTGAADPRAVFSWSYRALSSPAARIFRLAARETAR